MHILVPVTHGGEWVQALGFYSVVVFLQSVWFKRHHTPAPLVRQKETLLKASVVEHLECMLAVKAAASCEALRGGQQDGRRSRCQCKRR